MFYPKVGEFLSEDTLMADERTHLDGSGNFVSDEVLWALTDQQGTVHDTAKRDATTGVTAVADHIIYDSFGKVISESDPSQGTLIGYTGRPIDKATGQQNNLNRWYDPIIAGWFSQDPKGFAAGQTNLYVYCGNSATNATDPSGLQVYKEEKVVTRIVPTGAQPVLYNTTVDSYFYAKDDATAAAQAKKDGAKLGALSAAEQALVSHCNGPESEWELATLLTAR